MALDVCLLDAFPFKQMCLKNHW
ncbi:hypothetical protein [Vibrio mimicus]|nr:hypothetical protein [Vibrio mimicus]